MNFSEILINKDFYSKKAPPYLKEFETFYDTWKMHKYIGGGIKNFRYYCHIRPNIDMNSDFICNMHPHNYYLEILTETGLIGFLFCLSIFILVIYISLVKKYFLNSPLNKNNIIIFEPIKNILTSFTSQFIRLLYPCILNYKNGVLITDMDMLPMNNTYYTENIIAEYY